MSVIGANAERPGSIGTTTPGAWNDLQGGVMEGSAGAALTFDTFRDTPFKFAAFRDAQNDELHMTYQMGHGWQPGTNVHPHIHVIPLAAATGTVRFVVWYAWALFGQACPASAGWTMLVVDHVILASEVNKLDIIPLADIAPPADAHESDVLLVYLTRSGGAVEDTYGGNLAVVSVDTHIQLVKDGTDVEFPGA
jgi:hypothetical protein